MRMTFDFLKNVHFYQEKNLNWGSCQAFFFPPFFFPSDFRGHLCVIWVKIWVVCVSSKHSYQSLCLEGFCVIILWSYKHDGDASWQDAVAGQVLSADSLAVVWIVSPDSRAATASEMSLSILDLEKEGRVFLFFLEGLWDFHWWREMQKRQNGVVSQKNTQSGPKLRESRTSPCNWAVPLLVLRSCGEWRRAGLEQPSERPAFDEVVGRAVAKNYQ